MSLLYEDRTEILRRCFFDVQNEVGLGRNEEDYHPACKLWFAEQGLPVVSKPSLPLMLDGEVALVMFPDFVAWDAITIELKAAPRGLSSSEFVQLFNYLKFRRDRLGLLVNMGLDRVHVERILFEPPSARLIEDWSYWNGELDGHQRELGWAIRAALLAVYEAHGTGYGIEVVERLVTFALQRRGLSVTVRPIAGASFRGHRLPDSPLDCFVIADSVVLTLTALFENNDFNMNRGRSYMRALGLRWGIAANFGRSTACFTALRLRGNPRMAARTHG
jgi:GxxExxY protein